jgi:hypothetical protein
MEDRMGETELRMVLDVGLIALGGIILAMVFLR